MFKQIKRMPNIAGVASDALATGSIPTTGTLYEILLRIDGTVAEVIDEITNIVVRADGEELVNADPEVLLNLEKYYGDCISAGNQATATHTILPIKFDRPWLPSDSERSLFAIGLADVGALQIDVQCVTLDTITTIELFAVMTPENRRLGQHVRLHRFPQVFGTTGHHEIANLPRGGVNEAYLAMHIWPEATDLDIIDVTVKKGGYAIIDQVPALMMKQHLAHNLRQRQVKYYHVDFAASRDLLGFIPMANVKDWRLDVNWTNSPTTYNVYTERIFGLNIVD